MKKIRVDQLLVDKKLVETRSKGKTLIIAGEVYLGSQRIDKTSLMVPIDSEITIKKRSPYVSRGAYKLLTALDHFSIDVKNFICVDIGASTGGFTDLLLQKGAKFIYAIDVGTNQLDYKLRVDKRVESIEKTNARYFQFDKLKDVDLYVMDLSFISLKLIFPSFVPTMRSGSKAISLIKPQFEAGKEIVDRYKGVISDKKIHQTIVEDIKTFLTDNYDITIKGVVPSKIKGGKGNQEFIIYFEKI